MTTKLLDKNDKNFDGLSNSLENSHKAKLLIKAVLIIIAIILIAIIFMVISIKAGFLPKDKVNKVITKLSGMEQIENRKIQKAIVSLVVDTNNGPHTIFRSVVNSYYFLGFERSIEIVKDDYREMIQLLPNGIMYIQDDKLFTFDSNTRSISEVKFPDKILEISKMNNYLPKSVHTYPIDSDNVFVRFSSNYDSYGFYKFNILTQTFEHYSDFDTPTGSKSYYTGPWLEGDLGNGRFILAGGGGDACWGFLNLYSLDVNTKIKKDITQTSRGCGEHNDEYLGYEKGQVFLSEYEWIDSNSEGFSLYKNLYGLNPLTNKTMVYLSTNQMPKDITTINIVEHNDSLFSVLYSISNEKYVYDLIKKEFLSEADTKVISAQLEENINQQLQDEKKVLPDYLRIEERIADLNGIQGATVDEYGRLIIIDLDNDELQLTRNKNANGDDWEFQALEVARENTKISVCKDVNGNYEIDRLSKDQLWFRLCAYKFDVKAQQNNLIANVETYYSLPSGNLYRDVSTLKSFSDQN